MLSCVMVLYLESPPSTGCDASFKSLDFLGRLATRSVQSAAREVGSRQEVGDCSLRLEAGRAPPARLRRASRRVNALTILLRLCEAATWLHGTYGGNSADRTYFSDMIGRLAPLRLRVALGSEKGPPCKRTSVAHGGTTGAIYAVRVGRQLRGC